MSGLRVGGVVRVPGDKSISHRALLLAALARGTSRIRNVLQSADVASTAGVLRAMGVDVPALAPDITVTGRGHRGLRPAAGDLDCGNSGTTARLAAGVVAGQSFAARFTGDASLSRRPMRRIARPLEAMGARVELAEGGTLPMIVQGGVLRPVEWESEVASAQVKSAVLLAALAAGVSATVREPGRSRDHTERMLAAMGASVSCRGEVVSVAPVERLRPLDIVVPGDPSSAAFPLALAALAAAGSLTVPDIALNPTRTGFLAALRRMGADLRVDAAGEQGGEPVGSVTVAPAPLRGITLGADEVPALIDELPLLACLAARAQGETEIRGASELRVKESDRIAAVVAGLRAVGAEAEELPDGLRVLGHQHPLQGTVATHGDHRLAMAFGVLAALPGNRIAVDDPTCVAVSFPDFWSALRSAAA